MGLGKTVMMLALIHSNLKSGTYVNITYDEDEDKVKSPPP